MKKLFTTLSLFILGLASAHASVFGVKLGSNGTRQASLSFQTKGQTEFKLEVEGAECAEVQKAGKENFFVAKYLAGPLLPSKEYKYKISDASGNVLKEGSLKTKPDFFDKTPPPDFSFAALGQNYDNEKDFDPPFQTPGGEYEIYNAIAEKRPDFAIWMQGASILRPADRDSISGIAARFSHAFSLEEIQKMLGSFPNYAVFNARGAKSADGMSANKHEVRKVFEAFWQNPEGDMPEFKNYSFTYADVEFFVLDDFSARETLDYRSEKPRVLGQKQIKWLMNSLSRSNAKFKVIVMGSPIMNPVESPENFTAAASERKELLDFLLAKKTCGVLCISAGKGYGEVTRMVRAGGYPILDVTVPVLTGRPKNESEKEMNYFRMPNSGTFKRAFCVFKVEGPENSRSIKISFYDSKGEETFTSTVTQEDLYKFE